MLLAWSHNLNLKKLLQFYRYATAVFLTTIPGNANGRTTSVAFSALRNGSRYGIAID
jgi:hypothetical protein